MKLVAKAKPVKIRIKSGGEEHSSLDSLKRDFRIDDIKPLLDGRLSRWLRQQGEVELSEIVSELNPDSLNTPEGIMDFMNVFFGDYIASNSITSLFELIKSWLNTSVYRLNGENLFGYVVGDFDNDAPLDITKELFKNKDKFDCPRIDWYMVFELRTKKDDAGKTICKDPEVLFILGKLLFDGYQFNDFYIKAHFAGDPDGLKLIEDAARLGCQDAVLFFRDGHDNKKHESRFSGIDKEEMQRWIKEVWGWNDGIPFNQEYKSYNFNKKERLVVDFVNRCQRIYYDAVYVSLNTAEFTYNYSFIGADCANLFTKEIIFIKGLLYYNKMFKDSAAEEFKKIQDKYPLARYMLSNDILFGKFYFKQMPFNDQLEFVVKHLFNYE